MVGSLFHKECDIFAALCWRIGTPVAWRALCMLKREDWLGLVSIKIEPKHYASAKQYYEDCQIAAFFKKFPDFDLGFDLKKEAVDTFWAAEHQCYRTNERLSPLLFDLGHYGSRMQKLLSVWRKKIKTVLGRAPLPSELDGRFGPGSTFRNHGTHILIADKLSDGYTMTEHASRFLHSWDETAWSRYAAEGLEAIDRGFSIMPTSGAVYHRKDYIYAVRSVERIRGNRFTTVPKDARKLRGICVEPSLNVYYQLGVGAAMTRAMRNKLGWEKDTQQSYHRTLARIGSLTGSVATIDLSSASDTVCYNLVRLLLPRSWFRLVDELRSPFTRVDGKWVKLEKFSSMGNGFTFELETLIFWTLALALQELEPPTEDSYTPGLTTSVFGDDIIVPSSCASSLVAALRFFGFTPNEQKTFLQGPFRESCGGDYFDGHDVRPFYLRKALNDPAKLITLANGLRRFGHRHDDLGGYGHYRVAWFRTLDYIPRQIRRCRGPEELGDLVIWDEPWSWDITVRNSQRYLRVWRPVPNRVIGWDHWRPGVVLAAALYGARSGLPESLVASTAGDPERWRHYGVIPRINGSYVSGYRFGRVAYS